MFISLSYLKDSFLYTEHAIETSFLFALVPVKILVTEENSTENRPETMSHPIVLEDDNSQASSSSSVLMPSNFGECAVTLFNLYSSAYLIQTFFSYSEDRF